MAERRRMLRLFVAVYPPGEAAAAMLGLLERFAVREQRSVSAEQVHMTLQFIGDTDPRQLDEVKESVERGAAGIGAFELTPRRLVTLPERGEPRLVALVTDAPAGLLEMQRRLAQRLARNPRDRQRFLPHFTLCRFRSEARPRRMDEEVELPAFRVEALLLMESVLRPERAEHREVARVGLG